MSPQSATFIEDPTRSALCHSVSGAHLHWQPIILSVMAGATGGQIYLSLPLSLPGKRSPTGLHYFYDFFVDACEWTEKNCCSVRDPSVVRLGAVLWCRLQHLFTEFWFLEQLPHLVIACLSQCRIYTGKPSFSRWCSWQHCASDRFFWVAFPLLVQVTCLHPSCQLLCSLWDLLRFCRRVSRSPVSKVAISTIHFVIMHSCSFPSFLSWRVFASSERCHPLAIHPRVYL